MQPSGLYEGICDLPINPFDPGFRTRYFPSVIVFTLAVGWYYLSGLFSAGGTTALFALIPFFFTMILAGLQCYVIGNQPPCPPIPFWGFIGAFAIGILSGFGGYNIANATAGAMITPVNVTAISPPKEGFTAYPNTPISIFSNPTNITTASSESTSATQCAAPNDQTFMVDLYKNGKLISTAVTEQT